MSFKYNKGVKFKFLRSACTLFLIFIIQKEGFSQVSEVGFSIKKGLTYENDNREIPIKLLKSTDSAHFMLFAKGRFGKGVKSIRKLSTRLIPTNDILSLDLKKESSRAVSLDVIKTNAGIFHVWYDLTKKGRQFYCQRIDLSTFTMGKKRLIAEINKGETIFDYSIPIVEVKSNGDQIFLHCNLPKDLKDEQHSRIYTYDKEFNQIQVENYHFPFMDWNFRIVLLDNFGAEDKIMVVQNLEKKGILSKTKCEYRIFRLQGKNFKLIAHLKGVNTDFIQVKSSLTKDGHVVLAGFYHDFKKLNQGTYFAKVDLENEVILTEKQAVLSSNFITELLEEGGKKKRARKKLDKDKFREGYYQPLEIFNKTNNRYTLIAEKSYKTVTSKGQEIFHYKDIAVFDFDSKGNLINQTKIAKNQIKANVNIYSSFYPVQRKNRIFMIYNGNIMNRDHAVGKVYQSQGEAKNRAIIATSVDEDLSYKRHLVASYGGSDNTTLRTKSSFWINDDELLLFSHSQGNMKLQKFTKLLFK